MKFYNANDVNRDQAAGPYLDQVQYEATGAGVEAIPETEFIRRHYVKTGENITAGEITAPVLYEVEEVVYEAQPEVPEVEPVIPEPNDGGLNF
jgi:hypothetical protein